MNRRLPSALAWLLLVVGLVVFISAARWQYGKAELKQAQIRDHEAAIERAAVPLDPALAAVERGYDRVRVRGRVLARRYLLDNQIRERRPGVEVFAPLRGDDGTELLIALGWLPYPDTGRERPPLPAVDPGEVEWTGLLTPPPAHGLRMGRDWAAGQAGEIKLIPYFALEELAADAGLDLAPRILRLDPAPESGWRRDWRPSEGMPPERHRAYAWQWWSLAIASIVIFIVLQLKRRPRP